DPIDTARNVAGGLLVAVELALLWATIRDTPPGLRIRYEVRRVLVRLAAPCAKCREFQSDRLRVLWHAYLHSQGKFEDDEGVVRAGDVPRATAGRAHLGSAELVGGLDLLGHARPRYRPAGRHRRLRQGGLRDSNDRAARPRQRDPSVDVEYERRHADRYPSDR